MVDLGLRLPCRCEGRRISVPEARNEEQLLQAGGGLGLACKKKKLKK